MISFREALDAVRARAPRLPTELLDAAQAVGRVLAEDLIAPESLPGFDNAAMDGFALGAAHLTLPPDAPIPVSRRQFAGDGHGRLDGGACQIMTGARLPLGAVAVVPVERVRMDGEWGSPAGLRIRLAEPVPPDANIRRAGQDVQAGQCVLHAGTRLAPKHLLLLAALGIARVRVRAVPKAAVLCTGSELLADGDVPRDGHIRNANGPYLCAALAAMGAEVVLYRALPDAAEAYVEAVRAAEAAGAHIIVSTGAVSMGVHDFVPAALQSMPADIVFHKLAMRPGKPTLFAVLPSGALLFGLPGNPMSSACGLRFFVQTAARAMQGRADESPRRAVLAQALDKKPGWTLLQRASLQSGADGVLRVQVLPDQESFRIQPFVQADVWAALPAEAAHVPAGSVLTVYPIDADAAD